MRIEFKKNTIDKYEKYEKQNATSYNNVNSNIYITHSFEPRPITKWKNHIILSCCKQNNK